ASEEVVEVDAGGEGDAGESTVGVLGEVDQRPHVRRTLWHPATDLVQLLLQIDCVRHFAPPLTPPTRCPAFSCDGAVSPAEAVRRCTPAINGEGGENVRISWQETERDLWAMIRQREGRTFQSGTSNRHRGRHAGTRYCRGGRDVGNPTSLQPDS